MPSDSDETVRRTAMVRLLRQVGYRERRAKLIWSTRYRMAVIGFGLVYYGFLVRMDVVPLRFTPVLFALGVLAANSLVYLLFRSGHWREILMYLLVLGDMAGITVVAHYSGGISSPLVMIFLLQVVATAVYGTVRMAGTMAFLCIVCYGLLGGALIGHVVPPVPLAGRPPVDLLTAFCMWIGFSCMIGLAWLSSGFFGERLKVKETELEKLHHRLDRRIFEIQILTRLSNAVGSTLRLEQLLERLRAILRHDLPLDQFRIYLLEQDNTRLALLLSDPDGAPAEIADGPLLEIATLRDPSWLEQRAEQLRLFGEQRIEKTLLMPMQSEAHPLGLFVIGRTRNVPDLSVDLDFYRAISNQVIVGIERTRLYERTEADSQTDGLTGLYNYRFFINRLTEEMTRAERFDRPLSLILVDLDHFKQFNDTYGHLEGDYLLQEIAELLRGAVRHEKGDIAARHGGEEFALILPEADAQTGLLVAERLRKSIQDARYRISERLKPGMRVSASMGIATIGETYGNAEEMIALADQAMYQAKADGRNCVKAG